MINGKESEGLTEDPKIAKRKKMVEDAVKGGRFDAWPETALQKMYEGFLVIDSAIDQHFNGRWGALTVQRVIEELAQNAPDGNPIGQLRSSLVDEGIEARHAVLSIKGTITRILKAHTAPRQRGYISGKLAVIGQEISENERNGNVLLQGHSYNQTLVGVPHDLRTETTKVKGRSRDRRI